jgi:hypothetical protein
MSSSKHYPIYRETIFPIIHICLECKTPFVHEVFNKVPRFCKEKCRSKSYLRTQRQHNQKKRALSGAKLRPKARKGPRREWGDIAVRSRLEKEKINVHRTTVPHQQADQGPGG